MSDLRPLSAAQLCRGCDPDDYTFETTDDLPGLEEIIGQPRAVGALEFGLGMRHDGYNIFGLGAHGTGKHTIVLQALKTKAVSEDAPPDICYIHNFSSPHSPRILQLPPGRGPELSRQMASLIEDIPRAVTAALEGDDYRMRGQVIQEEYGEKQRNAVEQLRALARQQSLDLVSTQEGLVFAPVRDGEVIPQSEFQKLPEEERKRIEDQIGVLQKTSQEVMAESPKWEKEYRDKARELGREVAGAAIDFLIDELRRVFADLEVVLGYLDDVTQDILDSLPDFLGKSDDSQTPEDGTGTGRARLPNLSRYGVNLLVDNGSRTGAPVVYEDNPTYQNLVGRIEHASEMGVLFTDFRLIKAGALHRANGGYLLIDAHKLLRQPLAWEGLKRAHQSNRITIESGVQGNGIVSATSLNPEPLPLKVKVVLIGDPGLHYQLELNDPEFGDLFKVKADFATQMHRTDANEGLYTKMIATLARRDNLRAFDRSAVARVVQHGSRLAGDAERLSIQVQGIVDLLREADHWAGREGAERVRRQDVERAIESKIHRSDRIREHVQEDIQRRTILIGTEGAEVGQVNGLAVVQVGDIAFGRPSRITAQVRLGRGEVVDIEREVELSGPLHAKGVLILSGFLGGRYATEIPLSLSASLVFEQSYGGVDGDSASSAELYALLSAISRIPIRQSLAVTGSVNQHGMIQAIGGVNDKIEGFFDICQSRGLTGDQGVLIPESNVKHLMLRQDVIDAVSEEQFSIFPVSTIDEGIELLTGMPAGAPDDAGSYPADSVNGRVQACLRAFAERRLAYATALTGDDTR